MFDSIQMQEEEERKILTGVENLKMSLYPANPRCPGSAADHISRFVWTSVLITHHAEIHTPYFPRCCGTVPAFLYGATSSGCC